MNIARQFKKTPAKKVTATVLMDIASIRTDGGTQSRAELNQAVVEEYALAIAEGARFPAIVVFEEGLDHHVADGFHRLAGHLAARKKKILVEIRKGTRRDAILYSVGANADHGLPRTIEDKRRAVLTLLDDAEWVLHSERWIAATARVSHTFVQKLRAAHLATLPDRPSEREVARGQETYTMNTAAIGKPVPAAADLDHNKVPAGLSDAQVEELPDVGNIPGPVDHTAFHEGARESLPQAIKNMEAAKRQAIARRGSLSHGGLSQEDRIAELEENVRLLETENEALEAENKTYNEMKVQFEQGGFDKVIADKDEEIRVLKTRVVRESEDKASWAKSSKFWKDEAVKLGYSRDALIDIETGEVTNG